MSQQKIVRISFRYRGSYAQFEPHLDGFVAQLQGVSGLLWKIWTYDESRACGAGLYLFASEQDARAYLAFMLPQMRQMCLDVEGEVLDFHERATEGTRGPVGARWIAATRAA